MTMFRVPPGNRAERNVVSIGFSTSLDRHTIDRIAGLSRRVQYRRAQGIAWPAGASLPMMVLRGGMIKLTQSLIDGRQQIVDFLTAGDVLICGSGDAGCSQVAEAATDVEVCEIDLGDTAPLEAAIPGLIEALLVSAIGEIARKNRHVMILGRKRSDERVATFLLDYANRMSENGGAADRFRLPMSRADIADYLGLTAETISRALSVLREEGMVELPRAGEVVLRDRARLARVAAGGANLSVR